MDLMKNQRSPQTQVEVEESYRLLAQGDGFRIGLATEAGPDAPPSISIEFLMRLFRWGQRLGPADMERASGLVAKLTAMGYSVSFQEEGWVSCEKPIREADAEAEARSLRELLKTW
jgi:hypothetical protein